MHVDRVICSSVSLARKRAEEERETEIESEKEDGKREREREDRKSKRKERDKGRRRECLVAFGSCATGGSASGHPRWWSSSTMIGLTSTQIVHEYFHLHDRNYMRAERNPTWINLFFCELVRASKKFFLFLSLIIPKKISSNILCSPAWMPCRYILRYSEHS